MATEMERLRRNFLTILEQELRTPLSIIRSSVEFLAQNMAEMSPRQHRECLDFITVGYQGIAGIIDNIHALAASEADSRLDFQVVDMAALAADCVARLARLFHQKGQRLASDLPAVEATGYEVQGNPEQLRHALSTLLLNANRYTPEEERVHVSISTDNGQVLLTISDSGPGISATSLPGIFDRFARLGEYDPGQPGGLGLGLKTAYSIACRHGGTLTVASEVSRGSKFTLALPRVPPGAGKNS